MIYDKRINSGNLNSNARFDWRQHKAVALLAVRGAVKGGTASAGGGGTAPGEGGCPAVPPPAPGGTAAPGARPPPCPLPAGTPLRTAGRAV